MAVLYPSLKLIHIKSPIRTFIFTIYIHMNIYVHIKIYLYIYVYIIVAFLARD